MILDEVVIKIINVECNIVYSVEECEYVVNNFIRINV